MPGAPALPFVLNDLGGRRHTLAQFKGRSVVLCFFCGCAACHGFAREWGRLQKSGALAADSGGSASRPVTIIIESGAPAELRAFAKETALDLRQTVLLLDPGGRMARAYDAILCPRLCVLDAHGIVRYFNDHLDDAPQKAPVSVILSHVVSALQSQYSAPHTRNSPVSPARDRPAPPEPAAATGLTVVPQPGLTVRPDGGRLDLGFIDRLEAPKVERTVSICNSGQAPIVIERVQPSCICMEAALREGGPEPGITLGPGQETALRITLNVTQLSPGPLRKSIWILRKGQSAPALTLDLTASTEPAVRFSPAALDFGRVRAGAGRPLRLSVAIDRRLIGEGTPAPPLVSALPFVKFVPADNASAARQERDRAVTFSYRAILSPNAPIGVFSGSASLTPSTAGRKTIGGTIAAGGSASLDQAVSIPVQGEVVGEIAASPGTVLFDVVHPGKDRPRRITLTAAYAPSLHSLRVSSPAPWLSLRLLPSAAGHAKSTRILEVAVNRKAPAGPVHADVVVTTETGKHLVLPVTAYVVPVSNP